MPSNLNVFSDFRLRLLFTVTTAFMVSAPLAAQQAVDRDVEEIAADFFERQCRGVEPTPNAGVLFGMVQDAVTRTPLAGSMVQIWWQAIEARGDTAVYRMQTSTDNAGHYLFCAAPRHVPLYAQASTLGRASRRAQLLLGGTSLFTRRDLDVFLTRADGALSGRIVDSESGRPIQAASLMLEELGVGTLSDSRGRFRLREIPAGAYPLEIRHVAYGTQQVGIEVEPGQSTAIEIQLAPEAIAVEPIAVQIDVRPQWLENVGFYARQERGLGQFITPKELDNSRSRRFSQILQTVPGLQMTRVCEPHCSYILQMSTNSRTACTPQFYVDGKKVWMPAVVDLDGIAPTSDLAAVEVYRGISQTPAQYYGICGSIVIWTRRGMG